ncbi:thiosulfate sulfurtransferase 16, chloroplastic [Typha latifolia]|uniref:thiosulfate sulfurtransferase 16, chloroplastic n=1 Tax=Typha latifolia TaxID=4733 RepID=UPI003C307675
MASFASVSLPVLIALPSIKRLPPSLLSGCQPFGLKLGLVSYQCQRTSFLRVSSLASASSSETVVPRSVPVRVAHELLQAGHRYLDVRTIDEFTAGHPVGAVNIPYMFKVGSGMKKNPKFLEEVSSVFGKDDEIVVGCQSGKRSLMAAAELTSSGFTGVTDVAGGYSTWVQNELPIQQ